MRRNATVFNKNEIVTPHPGVQGKTGPAQITPPGAPFILETENRPVQNLEVKKNNENSQVQIVSHETVEGQIVAAGDYRPEYCEKMIEYFESVEKVRIVTETMTWKNGEVREIEKEIPNPPPQFSEYARSIGVTHRKLKAWAKDHPEFSEAYTTCEEIFKEFLIANGLTGNYPGQFTTFVAKNETDMKDEHTVNNRTFNMTDFLNKLERGEK